MKNTYFVYIQYYNKVEQIKFYDTKKDLNIELKIVKNDGNVMRFNHGETVKQLSRVL